MFPLPYDQVSRFASNLATSLAVGIDLRQAIRTGSQSVAKSSSGAWQTVLTRVDNGETLSEALRAIDSRLPPFFIPIVEAGELTGRLEESLRFLAEHCQMLARPTAALRNVWLGPLAVVVCGHVLLVAAHLLFGTWGGLLSATRETIILLGSIAAIAVLLIYTPLRYLVDRVKLLIPILGQAEREMAVNRFLRVFAMLYSTGGMRVEQMIRHASRAVTIQHLRTEFRRAMSAITRGETVSAAFATLTVLNPDEKDAIATGDLAGRIPETCERLASQVTDSLEARMKLLTPILMRITLFLVALSLAGSLIPVMAMLVMRYAM